MRPDQQTPAEYRAELEAELEGLRSSENPTEYIARRIVELEKRITRMPAGLTVREVVELAGFDPARILPESVRDTTRTIKNQKPQRFVSFSAVTPAGLLRASIEVDA